MWWVVVLIVSIAIVIMLYACVAINPKEDDLNGSMQDLQETGLPDPLQTESGLGEASEKDKPTS